jgi:preprotein translocase subunit SecG
MYCWMGHWPTCATLFSVLPLFAALSDIGRPAFVFFHFMTALALIGLVLMHSGRDTGMGGLGYVPASQGGTHIVERNLTRLTIIVGTIFFINTVVLYHLLA